MRVRGRARSRPRRRAWSLAPIAVCCALLATVAPPSASPIRPVTQDVSFAAPPRVTDPQPAPGSVVPSGPVVVAARVHDDRGVPAVLLVDGAPVEGLPADPDGDLSPLDGRQVLLSPGRHVIGVQVGDAVVREWAVVASGLEVLRAEEGDDALARRLRPPVGDRDVAVLVDHDRPDLAVTAAPIAALLGGVVLPTGPQVIPSGTWAALAQMDGGAGPSEVVLLGAEDHIALAVEAALGTAGMTTARIDAATPTAAAAAGTAYAASRRDAPIRALVVGPAAPVDDALAAALAAARLDAGFVMAGPTLDPATADVIAQHDVVLLSRQLTPDARSAVVAALGPDAVASDDDLAQQAAREAVVIPDDLAAPRVVAAALAASPGRAVLLGADAATTWVGRHAPDRITLVAPDPGGRPAAPAVTLATGTAAHPGIDPSRPALPAARTSLAELAGLSLPAIIDPDAPAAPPPAGPALDPDAPAAPAAPVTQPSTPLPDPSQLETSLRTAWVDGPDAPAVGAVVEAGDALRVTASAGAPVEAATVHVTVLGYEWPGRVEVDGPDITWIAGDRPVLPLPLEPPRRDTPTPVEITVDLRADGRPAHARFVAQVPLSPLATTSPEGWTVAGGSSGVTGASGPVYTYSVEVEPQTGLDIAAVEAEVTSILTDPRSWTADGLRLQRIGSSRARLRVVVATPATVDRLCGDAGLRTGGRVSCWDGYRAMLNLDRWTVGVPHFGGDLVTYRQYLVNHEVGHGLNHRHVGCPRPGMLAPVMMQQTGGVGACQPNGWPFP